MSWLSKLADKLVLAAFLNNAESMAHAAPALQFRRANKRKYTVVTVEAKWETLELARKNRQDLQTVLAVRSDTPDLGCNEYGAASWSMKEHEMYWVNCGFALSGNCVHHYCLFADPGTHSYKECLVSLLWCWEINQGMHCPWQHLLPGKMLTPDEAHMDEREMAFAARQKLERVASYRQLQRYSNQLRVMSRYSRPRVTLASFKLSDNFHVRPVTAQEGRKTERGEHQDISYIVNKETGVRTAILPAVRIAEPLLVLGLDQGSPGMAGGAFMMFYLHLMVFCKFDWIHRLIRDIKGAENGCCKKIFTKTKLWSSYLFSLRKRPFGSGANATMMERLKDLFELQCDINSPVFKKYLPKLAKAWKMPYSTDSEKQSIFDRVLDVEAFRKHGSHPKLANWFAWNQASHDQTPDSYAVKMVFTDPDDCGSFEIGAAVDRLMKAALQDHVRIAYVVENPCWDYYTHGIEFTKSPADNLKRTWGLSNNRWAASPHLFGTLRHALLELDSLEFMQIPMGESPQATKTLHLAWTLTAKLAWSMSKESAPPNCYSEILQPGAVFAAVRQTNADKMKTHHENVLSLELARHNFADAAEVWEACLFLNMAPIRLMFEYYRRDKYSAMSPDGRHLMMGMLATLADNKIVEDVHAPLRLASKGNNND